MFREEHNRIAHNYSSDQRKDTCLTTGDFVMNVEHQIMVFMAEMFLSCCRLPPEMAQYLLVVPRVLFRPIHPL